MIGAMLIALYVISSKMYQQFEAQRAQPFEARYSKRVSCILVNNRLCRKNTFFGKITFIVDIIFGELI